MPCPKLISYEIESITLLSGGYRARFLRFAFERLKYRALFMIDCCLNLEFSILTSVAIFT